MLEPYGSMIKIDDTRSPLPHSDARVLVSLSPSKELSGAIEIQLNNGNVCCEIESLGGLNACYLCRREGHIRRKCPLIRNKTNVKTTVGGMNKDNSRNNKLASKLEGRAKNNGRYTGDSTQSGPTPQQLDD